ncbi:MAG: flagellin [Bacteriovoracaceae bacterium]|jgi:flagellin|nr:flagellin [Bacteriovoracaceae bacterium]
MGLRIRTNVAAQAVQKNLRNVDRQSSESFQKLASGKRIVKAADDAAGLAISSKMEAEIRGNRMALKNTGDAISVVQIAEGGLTETSNIMTRLRELSIQAASDTVGDKEREFLDLEYQQLVQEVDRISKTTKFGDVELLSGENETGEMEFHVGAYGDELNKIKFDSEYTDATASNLGVEGTGISSKSDAIDNLEAIDNAIQKVSGFRANFGAIQSRLQTTAVNLDSQITNTEAAKSQIQDVDVAAESSKIASNNVFKQAATSVLAQANNIPNTALRLIG